MVYLRDRQKLEEHCHKWPWTNPVTKEYAFAIAENRDRNPYMKNQDIIEWAMEDVILVLPYKCLLFKCDCRENKKETLLHFLE